jgi:hypothetical protein
MGPTAGRSENREAGGNDRPGRTAAMGPTAGRSENAARIAGPCGIVLRPQWGRPLGGRRTRDPRLDPRRPPLPQWGRPLGGRRTSSRPSGLFPRSGRNGADRWAVGEPAAAAQISMAGVSPQWGRPLGGRRTRTPPSPTRTRHGRNGADRWAVGERAPRRRGPRRDRAAMGPTAGRSENLGDGVPAAGGTEAAMGPTAGRSENAQDPEQLDALHCRRNGADRWAVGERKDSSGRVDGQLRRNGADRWAVGEQLAVKGGCELREWGGLRAVPVGRGCRCLSLRFKNRKIVLELVASAPWGMREHLSARKWTVAEVARGVCLFGSLLPHR